MDATLPAAAAAPAHGTGLGAGLMKLFHWTCIGSMVFMAAAHGGSLLTMASNFVTMHILPGLGMAPQAIGNLATAFGHAVGLNAAPAIDPGIILDHTAHGHLPSLSGEWAAVATPELQTAFAQLPPDIVHQFNQSSDGLKSYIVENYNDLSMDGKRSLASIITDVCQPR